LTRAVAWALAVGLQIAASAMAQTVVDGDTIKIAGTTYRLWGIDAAESHQTCADGWPAGVKARRALAGLIHGHTVTCHPKVLDRHGRAVGVCWAGGVDLSEAMVLAGEALAFVRYTRYYSPLEAAARAAHRGMHAHQCEKPWDYRARVKGHQ
jgi:endonuclease YncB( thermonuclease family)